MLLTAIYIAYHLSQSSLLIAYPYGYLLSLRMLLVTADIIFVYRPVYCSLHTVMNSY
jgi:hypothetical protein